MAIVLGADLDQLLLVIIGQVDVLSFQCFEVTMEGEYAGFEVANDLRAWLVGQATLLTKVVSALQELRTVHKVVGLREEKWLIGRVTA